MLLSRVEIQEWPVLQVGGWKVEGDCELKTLLLFTFFCYLQLSVLFLFVDSIIYGSV